MKKTIILVSLILGISVGLLLKDVLVGKAAPQNGSIPIAPLSSEKLGQLSATSPASTIIIQNSNMNWSLPVIFCPSSAGSCGSPDAYTMDLNGDGLLDVIRPTYIGNSVYINNGNGTWNTTSQYNLGIDV